MRKFIAAYTLNRNAEYLFKRKESIEGDNNSANSASDSSNLSENNNSSGVSSSRGNDKWGKKGNGEHSGIAGDSSDNGTNNQTDKTALKISDFAHCYQENEAFKEKLRKDLKLILGELVQSVKNKYFDSEGKDKYDVMAIDSVRDAIADFVVCVEERYRASWISVFKGLFDRKLIKKAELDKLMQSYEISKELLKNVNECLKDLEAQF